MEGLWMRGQTSSPELFLFVETLEDRIAPAGIVTFTDIDGDVVTVKSSKGSSEELQNALVFSADGNVPKSLLAVNLGSVFAGTTFSVTTGGGGDGLVNVGRIGSNFDIGKILIQGDVGSINVGDSNGKTPALKSLEVASIFKFGEATGALTYVSSFLGSVGSIKVAESIFGAKIQVSDGVFDSEIASGWKVDLKKVEIGQSLAATTNEAGSGSIQVEGNIGKVVVGANLVGGGNERSGSIVSTRGSVGSISIGGDIEGSSGFGSGSVLVSAGMLKKVDIDGNIYGATGTYSGGVIGAQIGKIFVGGDIIAGTGVFNAQIRSLGDMGSVFVQGSVIGADIMGDLNVSKKMSVKIGEDLNGGTISGAFVKVDIGRDFLGGAASNMGTISSNGSLEVHIHRNFVGGNVAGTDYAGYIFLDESGSKITVDGNVIGGAGTRSGSMQTPTFNDARSENISIKIGGDLVGGTGAESARIYVDGLLDSFSVGNDLHGGDGTNSGQVYTTGGIGKITIGHSVLADDGLNSGAITTLGNIKSMTVENDVSGKNGINYSQIGAGGMIGSLIVKGDVVNSIISAYGMPVANGKTDIAIKKLSVGIDFADTTVYAGYDLALQARNPDAQIGSVSVGSVWSNGKVIAGSAPGQDGIFGTQDDRLITNADPNTAAIIARVSSIVIGGSITGNANAISAQEVGSLKVGGDKVSLNKGPDNDFKILGAGNYLVENGLF